MNELLNYYNNYDEDIRLEKSNIHKLEYLTTIHYLDKIIPQNSKVLDISAGTGKYSFYLADKGHNVTAGDIVPRFVDIMKEKKIKTQSNIEIYLGDARDLSRFSSESFDVVLCMGPLYHLKEYEDRRKTIEQCLNILKKNGVIVVAYVNKFASYVSKFKRWDNPVEMVQLEDILNKGCYLEDKEDCFYFSSPKEIEELMNVFEVEKMYNIGTDGIGYLIGDRILSLNEEEYKVWLDYHFKTCENEHLLGYSLHGLYIGKKS